MKISVPTIKSIPSIPAIKAMYQGVSEDQTIRALVWLGVFGFVALLVWANVGRLDIFSVALGEVVPASRVKQIQHLEGGIVSEILIVEGQAVKQNQPLVVLAPTRSQADVDELSLRIAALKTDLVRLEAEAALKQSLKFNPRWVRGNSDLVEKSFALFNVRKNKLDAKLNVQTKLVLQRQQNYNEVKARSSKNQTVLKYIKEQIDISSELLALDLSNRMKHLELLRQAAEIEGEISISVATLGRVKAAIEEAEAKLVSIKADFIEEARTQKDEISRRLEEFSERLIRFQDSLSRTVLRAPVDGVVKTIYLSTEGGVVKPGSTVLEIVPSADKLVVEARLAISDIGYVRVGNTAQLQLSSPDAQMFDTLIGKVTYVGADTVINKDGIAFYKIRIETEQAYFKRGNQRYNLFPGMRVQSNIQTGTRTVMNYILSPFIKSANNALHER